MFLGGVCVKCATIQIRIRSFVVFALVKRLFKGSGLILSDFVSLLQSAVPANEHRDRAIIQHRGTPSSPPIPSHTHTCTLMLHSQLCLMV